MGLPKANNMKIFEIFFIDSQKLKQFIKNKLCLKLIQRFSEADRQILDKRLDEII
jgi:hypothetical protein